MRILLLNPPFQGRRYSRTSRSPAVTKSGTLYYPMWLAYAAGVLEKEGFETRLIDGPARGLSDEDIINILKDYRPDLVVIDTSTPSIYNDVKIAELVKEKAKGSFVILVGTHPSSLPEETLRLSASIDAVARGEYDYTIRDLAETLRSGRQLKSVSGISFRDGVRIIHNEKRPLIEDLDEIPFVSSVYKRHLRVADYFFAASFYPLAMIISGRGCPFRCSFCVYPQVFHSRIYRFRSPENIADEFEYIKNELPEVKEIGIEDDTFTVDKHRVEKFSSDLIKRRTKIPWHVNSRADLDYETMNIMKEAGCRLLVVGYESGSQKILDNIHKDIKLEDMARFNEDAKRAGLLVHGCFMIGNPGETFETLNETLEFAKRLNCDTAQFFPLMLYPGTEAYDWAKENGYIKSKDFSDWLTGDGLHNAVLATERLSAKDLVDFCDYARKQFYLRPNYVFYKSLKCLSNPGELIRTSKAFRSFYKHLF
ncbi:MAG: radical SAM protein [Candidatus Omnitrophica bacterium]|nr:radical SAM protein [Candidatus Omnitrophota bacterium]